MTLATSTDLTNIFDIGAQETSFGDNFDTKIDHVLEMAETEVYGDFGRNITQMFKYKGYNETKFTYFKPLESVERVYINHEDTILTSGTDYSQSLTDGTVTVSGSNLGTGDRIYVEFVPSLFKYLELFITLKYLINNAMIIESDETTLPSLEHVNKQILSLKRKLASYPRAVGVVENTHNYMTR